MTNCHCETEVTFGKLEFCRRNRKMIGYLKSMMAKVIRTIKVVPVRGTLR